jgi:hypothetical protein
MVDGTQLTYTPAIAGAPTTIKLGDVVDFESTLAFKVSSDKDHPFYIGQSMTGAYFPGGSLPDGPPAPHDNYLGDPDFVNVLPAGQYLSSYVFYADVTYNNTSLVLVRKSGGAEVTIDCLGVVSGWKAVGTDYEVVNVDLVRYGVTTNCKNGSHRAQSSDPFGLVVWGTDYAASYGYPAGGGVGAISNVVVDPDPK